MQTVHLWTTYSKQSQQYLSRSWQSSMGLSQTKTLVREGTPRSRMMMVHLNQLALYQGTAWDEWP
jgi:hypothetical protein